MTEVSSTIVTLVSRYDCQFETIFGGIMISLCLFLPVLFFVQKPYMMT